MNVSSDSIAPTPETIANRVRKRHRDVPSSSAGDEELAPFSEFVGILPMTSGNSECEKEDMGDISAGVWSIEQHVNSQSDDYSFDLSKECVMLSRSGRSYLCNQCPFEATELITVFRHLFAAHVFRCGRCNYYCTSRWSLRRHEQMKHDAFIGPEYALDPLSLRPDPVGDGFILMDIKTSETIARLASSRTPRLMNGLAGFVPSSIVTPIAVKQHSSVPAWKTERMTYDLSNSLSMQNLRQQSNSNDMSTLGYKCMRCDFTSLQLDQIRAHCSTLAESIFICPGICHFGSSNESEVRVHFFTCPNSQLKPNELQPANFINKDRYNIERFYCTYDPKDEDSSMECNELQWKPRINPDADLMKHITNPGMFVLKRNNQDEDFFSLMEQMNMYGAMTAEKMYPQPSIKNTKRKLPIVIRAVGLTVRSSKVGNQSIREAALTEFVKAEHQFILSSEEHPELSCPTEQSPYVTCLPLAEVMPLMTLNNAHSTCLSDDVIILDED